MKTFKFVNLHQWGEFAEFRAGPPPLDLEDLITWIHAIYIPSPHEATVDAAFDKVMRHHTGGNECWLGVTGPSHVGKSHTVTSVLMRRALAEPERWRARSQRGGLWTPYVYVEAASNQEARGLLSSIARACGLPHEGREKDLHDMLSETLPELGVRLIVVDDAQMFRRRSDNASRVTDGLRVVLHLPVPFAFVGVDLHASALLYRSTRNNDTALQLERRHLPLHLRPISKEQRRAAAQLIGQFRKRVSEIQDLDLTDGFGDSAVLSFVAAACEGRPGSILNALKQAVIEAIVTNDGRLTRGIVAAEADRARADLEREGA